MDPTIEHEDDSVPASGEAAEDAPEVAPEATTEGAECATDEVSEAAPEEAPSSIPEEAPGSTPASVLAAVLGIASEPSSELSGEAASELSGEAASKPSGEPSSEPQGSALRGAWTVARGPELLEIARSWDASNHDMTVDCTELERVDTSALQVLVAVRRAFAARGCTLSLANIRENVEKQVQLAGLEQELFA